MAKKVNPLIFRVQTFKHWENNWSSNYKEYGTQLHNSIILKGYVSKTLEDLDLLVSKLHIEQKKNELVFHAHTFEVTTYRPKFKGVVYFKRKNVLKQAKMRKRLREIGIQIFFNRGTFREFEQSEGPIFNKFATIAKLLKRNHILDSYVGNFTYGQIISDIYKTRNNSAILLNTRHAYSPSDFDTAYFYNLLNSFIDRPSLTDDYDAELSQFNNIYSNNHVAGRDLGTDYFDETLDEYFDEASDEIFDSDKMLKDASDYTSDHISNEVFNDAFGATSNRVKHDLLDVGSDISLDLYADENTDLLDAETLADISDLDASNENGPSVTEYESDLTLIYLYQLFATRTVTSKIYHALHLDELPFKLRLGPLSLRNYRRVLVYYTQLLEEANYESDQADDTMDPVVYSNAGAVANFDNYNTQLNLQLKQLADLYTQDQLQGLVDKAMLQIKGQAGLLNHFNRSLKDVNFEILTKAVDVLAKDVWALINSESNNIDIVLSENISISTQLKPRQHSRDNVTEYYQDNDDERRDIDQITVDYEPQIKQTEIITETNVQSIEQSNASETEIILPDKSEVIEPAIDSTEFEVKRITQYAIIKAFKSLLDQSTKTSKLVQGLFDTKNMEEIAINDAYSGNRIANTKVKLRAEALKRVENASIEENSMELADSDKYAYATFQELLETISKLTGYKSITLKVYRVTNIAHSAELLAKYVAYYVSRRYKLDTFKGLAGFALGEIMEDKAIANIISGIKISCAGTLKKGEMANTSWIRYSETQRLPRLSIAEAVDYGFAQAQTGISLLGIKAWIYYRSNVFNLLSTGKPWGASGKYDKLFNVMNRRETTGLHISDGVRTLQSSIMYRQNCITQYENEIETPNTNAIYNIDINAPLSCISNSMFIEVPRIVLFRSIAEEANAKVVK